MGGPDCLLLEGSVCDSHLHLWLQDSWVFWTKYLAAPLLKDVKDHALITWEMEFHRQFLKAIEDKLIQFIGSPETDIWKESWAASIFPKKSPCHSMLRTLKSRKFLTSSCVRPIRMFDRFPFSLRLLHWLPKIRVQHTHPHTHFLTDRRLLAGKKLQPFPRSAGNLGVSLSRTMTEPTRAFLLREGWIFKAEIRDKNTFLFYVPWNLFLIQGHPRIQTGVDLGTQKPLVEAAPR